MASTQTTLSARGSRRAFAAPCPGSRPRSRLGPACALAACVLAACGREADANRAITRTRTYELVGEDVKLHATSAERFLFRDQAGPQEAGLHWTTPPGWQELPTTSLRQANFLVAGDELAQCYLTILSRDGGGIAANVNRWREQMSLPVVSETEVLGAPRIPFFGGEGLFVDLTGTWTGMSGEESGEGYRMIGLVLVDAGGAKFLKMVGPADLVERELDSFKALAESFHAGGDHDHSGEGAEAQPATGGAPGGVVSADGMQWQPPDGWRPGPAKTMRLVTYFMGADDAAECYVSILGGNGGGTLANVNRWRKQMGTAELTEQDLASLPSIAMLGQDAVVAEIAGRYTGMGDADQEDALLLGAVCNLSDRAVYVKLVGPRAVVEPQREAFLAFCQSFESAR